MIDFHCHLDLFPDCQSLTAACRAAKIYVLAVTTTPSAWRGTRDLVDGCSRIKVALGLHPQLAHERSRELPLFSELLHEAQYVGEIGLDGSAAYRAHQATQAYVFETILRSVAHAGGRVMSIHSRGAVDPVLDALSKFHLSGLSVMHWFSGTKRQLLRAVEMGCWFSVGPAMLCTKKGREAASAIPRDRILTETDGPFALNNGKPLSPLDVRLATTALAEIWGESERQAEARILHSLDILIRSGLNSRAAIPASVSTM